jgi:hypothetical protein
LLAKKMQARRSLVTPPVQLKRSVLSFFIYLNVSKKCM